MSEIKAGDKIYFQGNQGKVMKVISDENEPLLEVVLTQKRVAYLNPSQLDLYPFAEKLNENQQIVIDLEMSDCSVEVTGWTYPDELDTENLRYLFDNVLENARALEQEEE